MTTIDHLMDVIREISVDGHIELPDNYIHRANYAATAFDKYGTLPMRASYVFFWEDGGLIVYIPIVKS